MVAKTLDIDISENRLRNRGRVLDILLKDSTKSTKNTTRNIIWAADSYSSRGKDYAPKKPILLEQITGINGKLILPRAAKTREEQKYRTKDKAEVFTPLKIVKKMNMAIDWASKNYPADKDTWINYISEKRLEITCGEAPYITGRYNPTASTGVIIKPENRVGFLDRKLQEVKRFVNSKKDWLFYAETALKACYGYEWQGDSLLIARENILMTMDDYYRDKFHTKSGLSTEQLEHFANIISWNVWQMDGLKYVMPMSCKQTILKSQDIPKKQLQLLPTEKPHKIQVECEGCRTNNPLKHTGKYAQVMDWETGKAIKFVDLIKASELI